MIVAIIVVILLCSAMSDWGAGKDWEASEENAERRHEELMNVYQNKVPSVKHKEERTIQRRAIRDSAGNTLVEEVIVESLEDLI